MRKVVALIPQSQSGSHPGLLDNTRIKVFVSKIDAKAPGKTNISSDS